MGTKQDIAKLLPLNSIKNVAILKSTVSPQTAISSGLSQQNLLCYCPWVIMARTVSKEMRNAATTPKRNLCCQISVYFCPM